MLTATFVALSGSDKATNVAVNEGLDQRASAAGAWLGESTESARLYAGRVGHGQGGGAARSPGRNGGAGGGASRRTLVRVLRVGDAEEQQDQQHEEQVVLVVVGLRRRDCGGRRGRTVARRRRLLAGHHRCLTDTCIRRRGGRHTDAATGRGGRDGRATGPRVGRRRR